MKSHPSFSLFSHFPRFISIKSTAVLALAVVLFLPAAAFAQSAATFQVQGVVTDSTGAVIPGATVTARNVATDVSRSVSTNETGRYRMINLPPGEYEITIESSGFSTLKREGLQIEVGAIVTLDFTLEVGATTEVVTVTQDVPLVETERTGVSSTISQELVEDLPINGRRWTDFVLLTPGVSLDGDFGLISYRGLSGLYNNNMVDGADNNQAFFSEANGRTRTAYTQSVSTIKEFQVGLVNYSAEFGRAAGGTVNAVTKSGGNEIHGEAFYFLRHDSMDARETFNKASGVPQLKDVRQQFGLSIGGPIKEGKMFWFANYDQQERNFPGVAVSDRTVTDGAGLNFIDSAFDVTAICDDVLLTLARCEAARQVILDELGVFPREGANKVALIKLDFVPKDDQNFSIQYNIHRWDSPNGIQTQIRTNDTPLANGSDKVETDVLLARHNWTISSTMVNELRFQFGRDFESQVPNAPGPSVIHNSQLDIDGGGMRTFLPRASFPDETRYQFTDNYSMFQGDHHLKFGIDINHVNDLMINLFTGGAQFEYRSFENFAKDVPLSGLPDFIDAVPALSGRHYRDFEQAFDLVTGSIGAIEFTTTDINFYIQDSWKVRSNLTLNMGVRYETTMMPSPDQSIFASPTAEWLGLTTALQDRARAGIGDDTNNWGPRVGLAWDVGGDQKMVVRAGYGISFGRTSNSAVAAGTFENNAITRTFIRLFPGSTNAPAFPDTFCTPNLGTPGQTSVCTLPAGTSGSGTLNLFSEGYQQPTIYSGELGVEYAITNDTAISATYINTRGQHLPAFIDINMPPPTETITYTDGQGGPVLATMPFFLSGPRPVTTFGAIIQTESTLTSDYNAVIFKVKRRMSKGLSFNSHLTIAKAEDDGQGSTTFFQFFSERVNPFDRESERGTSRFDIRKKWVTNFNWELPSGDSDNGAMKTILDGFSLSGILTFRGGRAHDGELNAFGAFPSGWNAFSTFSGNGSGADDRAPWLPRNFGRTSGLANVDIRLTREISVKEDQTFVIILEAFNSFNHVNFNRFNDRAFNVDGAFSGGISCTDDGAGGCVPGSRVMAVTPNASFLVPFAAGNTIFGPRDMQIAFKYIF